MKIILACSLLFVWSATAHALLISEVLSNPTGDDSGREWIEIVNDTDADVDLSTMTVSIKGATAVVTTPLQGGLILPPHHYAIIASVVSGQTKFLQDYGTYSGLLFRSSVSLVNTGITSIDIKLNGGIVASLPSYTAAKEGTTLSFVGGSYVTGSPTPGADNQVIDTATQETPTATTTVTDTQVTIPQLSAPNSDITIYLPHEKVVVAGAESEFSVFSQTRAGKPLNDLRYTWAFGDGGQATGSSTKYRYVYSGRYIATVEALNATTIGSGRMVVRVVAPDLTVSSVGSGKYGAYVDIKNPNTYDLDLSQWILSLDGAAFPFPKNTWLPAGGTTRFSGIAMGFASTTVSTSTLVKILFPNLEEVTRYILPASEENQAVQPTVLGVSTSTHVVTTKIKPKVKASVPRATSTEQVVKSIQVATSAITYVRSKDTRLVSWFRMLFSQ